MDIRIYYEDTDCGGVVYYANYLKYFERARTQYLEDCGLSVVGLLKEGVQFLVVHADLDYRSPARLGDTLTLDTTLVRSGNASLTFGHVVRERLSQRVVVEGSAILVTVDKQGKVRRLPPSLVETLSVQPAPGPPRRVPPRKGKSRSRRQA